VSIYPCDWHHRRVDGPLNAAYITLMRDGGRYSRRLRLCSVDLDHVLTEVLAAASLVETDDLDDQGEMPVTCGHPSGSPGDPQPLFVTVFRKGSDKQDFYGRLCPACGTSIEVGLKLQRRTD